MRTITILGIDLAAVLAFAAIGRASHAEALSLAGLAQTAWPFLVAVAIGSPLSRRVGGAWWRQGLVVWAVTVGVGLLLRVATGGGAAPGFVVVGSSFLALTLIGWRALARKRLA